jgi:branched-chain amino acid transport system ATP-binding protein
MGRALMGAPKLLMLDEPSLGLAPIIVADIFKIVGELRASGVSVLLVEQNAQGAFRIARARAARSFERVYTLFPRLKDRRRQLAGTLSGGEQQMLAMGRALMGAPKLLMLDEPSLGLAPIIVADIFKIVGELRASGVSVLLVEQNAQAALRIADRAYVMELGEFILDGSAKDIATNARVAASYLGFTHEGASAV